MKKLFGTLMAGALVLALASPSHAQVNVRLGRGGSFGQPTYGRPVYGQYPYAPQPAYARPYGGTTYSSGYSGYAAPVRAYTQPYYGPPAYAAPYRQPGYYTPPSYGSGTGVIINGRSYRLPR